MKNKKLIKLLASFTISGLLLAGCGDNGSQDSSADSLKDSVTDTGEMFAQKSTEAWQDLKDATYDERQQVESIFEESSKKLQSEMSQLTSTVSNTSGEAWDSTKSNYDKAYSEFQDQLDKLSDATEDNWDKVRSNTEDAWNELVEAYNEMVKT